MKPKHVEDAVLKEMKKRIEQLNIEKHEDSKANEINSIYAGDYEKMREEYETLCRMLSVKLSIQE